MSSYPLVFCFRDLIAGRGFVAAVETKGRLVLAQEDGGWNLYGVEPGGISGCAEDRDAAFADFRRTYQCALDDIAHEAASFSAFRVAVTELVMQTNGDVEAEWEALRDRVRHHGLGLEDFERRDTSGYVASVRVELVDGKRSPERTEPTPELNPQVKYAEAA